MELCVQKKHLFENANDIGTDRRVAHLKEARKNINIFDRVIGPCNYMYVTNDKH